MIVCRGLSAIFLVMVSCGVSADSNSSYPWLKTTTKRVLRDIKEPKGFFRTRSPSNSFAGWLRGLPLLPGRPKVLLHNGRQKTNQSAHYAVLDIDVGRRDLQQCADAVMRLRAEYLFANRCHNDIHFQYTSGDVAAWRRWRQGWRPRVKGNKVSWHKRSRNDRSYRNFRRYLDNVFIYAGSYSLSSEMNKVRQNEKILPGDVFIRGGFPGHAVMVVDVAMNKKGQRVFLLVQSFMPAQQIHVLRNPDSSLSPWYRVKNAGVLLTPEWKFDYHDLKRFTVAQHCR